MDRPAAKLPVDVCQRIVLLQVEFQVAVPVEKHHIGILAQKRLECRRLLTAPDVVGVDPQGIAAGIIIGSELFRLYLSARSRRRRAIEKKMAAQQGEN